MLSVVGTFAREAYKRHKSRSKEATPFVLGLSGPQGSGKSTVVHSLAELLRHDGLTVAEFSLDDVYLTHADQIKLAAQGNTLLQHRGLPGTHDIGLCLATFDSLARPNGETYIPSYDKSAFSGQGDRRTTPQAVVAAPVDIVLFEGWCVGFSPLSETDLSAKMASASALLRKHTLSHVSEVNQMLANYKAIWDRFDGFVHLDARDIAYVYDWRLQQEHGLIKERGTGMTDAQVRDFVDGYMPAYELYNDQLRQKPPGKSNYLHIVLNRDRTPTVQT